MDCILQRPKQVPEFNSRSTKPRVSHTLSNLFLQFNSWGSDREGATLRTR
eukprot:bmy_15998T0